MPTDNKVLEFFNAINEDLQRQVNEITDEANRLKADQIKKAKRSAKKQTDAYLRTELANMAHSNGRRVAAARARAARRTGTAGVRQGGAKAGRLHRNARLRGVSAGERAAHGGAFQRRRDRVYPAPRR